jgi:hypothetical protein
MPAVTIENRRRLPATAVSFFPIFCGTIAKRLFTCATAAMCRARFLREPRAGDVMKNKGVLFGIAR